MKKLFEKLKHPTEKTKHRLQGVAIGFLFGAILSFTCVGVVGCNMTQGESTQSQTSHTRKALEPRRAFSGGEFKFNFYFSSIVTSNTSEAILIGSKSVATGWGSTYTIQNFRSDQTGIMTLGEFAESLGGDVSDAYASQRSYNICPVTYNITFSTASYPYVNLRYTYYLGREYNLTTPTFDIRTLPSGDMSDYFVDFNTYPSTNPNVNAVSWNTIFKPVSDLIDFPVATSSEESSSEATTSAPETTSLDQSLGFVFGDQNPFSAWAVNPLSGDPAVNYDGGAPWLLYTGKPSGSGATTSQTALSTDYLVGSFYVAGNPSQVFDTIRVITLNLTTDNAFILNGSTDAVQISADQFARGAFMVSEVRYLNSQTSASIKVYNFGLTSAKLNGQDINALTSGSWLNVGYRSIVWTGGGDLTINGYKAPASWWLENNALSSASAVSTMILGNSSTGVFGLLASAFTCWGSIFGLALVPGLTIGTLLFVPLVVLVIFSIIKLLQK